MLAELEAAQVLCCGGIWRAPEERGETPDVADVVLLGMRSQTPHQHVVLHTLAQRADRYVGRQGSHGKFLSLKGTPCSAADLAALKAYEYCAPSPHATLPQSGFVLGGESRHRRCERTVDARSGNPRA